jgi:hypothetical protein
MIPAVFQFKPLRPNWYWIFAALLTLLGLACKEKAKPNLSRKIASVEYKGVVYQYVRSLNVKSCSEDSIPGTDQGFGKFYFTNQGEVIFNDLSIGDTSTPYYMGKVVAGDTSLICTFSELYSIPNQSEMDTVYIPINPNSGKLHKVSSFTVVLKPLDCKNFDFYSQDPGEKVDGTVYSKEKPLETWKFIHTLRQIKALAYLFKEMPAEPAPPISDQDLSNDKPAQTVKKFLAWYKQNSNQLQEIPLVLNFDNRGSDSTKLYRVNFEETEKYLSEFKKAGWVTEKYVGSWRLYFKEKDQYMIANSQWDGPPAGFEYDFVILAQDEDLEKLEQFKYVSVLNDGQTAEVICSFTDGYFLHFLLSLQGEQWMIDTIRNEAW